MNPILGIKLHAIGGLCIQASALQVWHDHSFANRPTDPIAIATLAKPSEGITATTLAAANTPEECGAHANGER